MEDIVYSTSFGGKKMATNDVAILLCFSL